MTILAAILHPYGVLDECITESCKSRHIAGNYPSRFTSYCDCLFNPKCECSSSDCKCAPNETSLEVLKFIIFCL